MKRETTFPVEPRRHSDVWQALRPSHNKPTGALTCSRPKCEQLRDREEQRYCSSCHAAYMRRWRKLKKALAG